MNYPKLVKTDATELTNLFFWDMTLPSRGIGLRRFEGYIVPSSSKAQ